MTGNRNTTAIAEFLERLGQAPASVLISDYDGTLAPFQADRHEAYPYPGVAPLLNSIHRGRNAKVVVISGRPVQEVRALLSPPDDLEIWGAHGLECSLPDGTIRQAELDAEVVAALHEAAALLSAAGLTAHMETKPGGVAVHWRGLANAEVARVRDESQTAWQEIASHPGLKLLQFDGGLELRTIHPDKGDAIRSIVNGLHPEAQVAFLGDDFTDEDAFRALGDRGLSLLVRSAFRDTAAHAWIKPPEELIDFLEQWQSMVEREG
ncbi:MAG TPA: trehalose-phosphatase [Granulicella sp.]